MKRYVAPAFWALGMGVLILDSRTALAGAAEGVDLCIRTLIPNLFPFFVLSALLTGALPRGGLLLTGLLGGYPVGAGNTAAAYRAGRLTREDAGRLAVVCNCPGPSFLFGVLGPVLGDQGAVFTLWGVYLLSVFILRRLLPAAPASPDPGQPVTVQQALWSALRAMAGVCGWVVLFRVGLAVLDRWVLWLLSDWQRAVVYGLLELTNGCLALAELEPGLRFVLAAGMVSFGGLCVLMQTAGVARELPLGLYFPGKVFQCALCLLLASLLRPGAVCWYVQVIFGAVALTAGTWLAKSEKRSGNPAAVMV